MVKVNVDNIEINEHYNLNSMEISIICCMYMECISVNQFYVISSITFCILYSKIEIKRDGGTYFIKISSCYPNLAENTMSLFLNYQLTWKRNHSTMIC